jgi:hypothetical protein
MAAAAQSRPQVSDRYLHPLVEVHDQRWSRPPHRFTPAGGGDARCVQVNVITKAGESVTRALALPFAMDIMRRVLPSWRPSRPSPSLFSSAHRTSTSGGRSSSSARPGWRPSPPLEAENAAAAGSAALTASGRIGWRGQAGRHGV